MSTNSTPLKVTQLVSCYPRTPIHTTPSVVEKHKYGHLIYSSGMEEPIIVTDEEPAHEWLNKLARESGDDRLFPEEYELNQVEELAVQIKEETLPRKAKLYSETRLSEREAEAVALKEVGLTHRGIALVMSLTSDNFGIDQKSSSGTSAHVHVSDDVISPSTVDEYVRRAREKYIDAANTYKHLNDVFYGIFKE